MMKRYRARSAKSAEDTTKSTLHIAGRAIGAGHGVFVVAEMSANHDRDLSQALSLVDLAADAGADALKLQTYTADSLTMRTSHTSARVDPIWGAKTLYELYERAAMPYEFHAPLFARAKTRGLIAFSSPFDEKGVDFLESLGTPAYKIASPEIVHLPLLRHVGRTRKPVILSTGMSNLDEVAEAIEALTSGGATDIALLHCCSVYPAAPETVNLAAMATLRQRFGRPVGFSDHTLGTAVPIAAASLGASIIEKHFTSDTSRPGPDHRFSLTGAELRSMVSGIRAATAAIGSGGKEMAAAEAANKATGRRSLFAARAIPAGTRVTADMIAVIRPGAGLHPRAFDQIVGKLVKREIPEGSPITWDDF